MSSFKRGQIEDAIARLSGDRAEEPSSELLTRIKRLLDTDRALEVLPRSQRPELANYAFFSGRSPGKGTEVQFSGYEAFALLIGLQMLDHNWPQKFVVETLRQLRPELERKHREILRLDPAQVLDQDESRLAARPGDLPLAAGPSRAFLLIWSDQRTAENPASAVEIFDDYRAALKRTLEKAGRSSTWIELTRPAHSLSEQLSRTAPRKRGRS
jgi:hypothetical protein